MRYAPAAIAALLAAVLCGCGQPGLLDHAAGRVQPIVSARGDQLHPYLSGDWLVWFDLRDDPDGFCFMPSYSPDVPYDDSCDGRVRSLNLVTGESHVLSDIVGYEVKPVASKNLVAWRCQTDTGSGMCVTPIDRKQVRFFAGVGTSNYYYDRQQRPWVDDGYVAWPEYEYYPTRTLIRIKRAALSTGLVQDAARLDSYPSELAFFGGLLAWNRTVWQDNQYLYQLVLMDSETGASTLVTDGSEPTFGLGGRAGLLAFKQGATDYDDQGDGGVHVMYRRPDGQVRRADSDAARVSDEGPVVVGDDLLVWLDHRRGDYQVVARDLASGDEAIVSPGEAVIGAYMPPAISARGIVWPDTRSGDFDLYLYSF